jgi:hypothetical protein
MKQNRARKWGTALGIAAGVLVLLIAGGLIGWRLLIKYFTDQYYQKAYAPITLTAEGIGETPAEHHLADVPWIAASLPVCQSTSLQMIAAQQAIVQPRQYFDFLMGFTYGATSLPGVEFAPFGTDPETGFAVAAPYLGLVRRYYVTDDEALYLRALRYYLAQGYVVRLALDMGALYGAEEFLAHSEVLVGYDAAGFYYYETTCIAPATCEPGQRQPGAEGLYVPDGRLLDAVRSQARPLSYPWRYALTVFEPGPVEEDLEPVWKQDSQAMLGGAQYGPTMGADAVEALAERIEQRGTRSDASEIRTAMELTVQFRLDNAAYLRGAFPGDPDIEQAAALFDQAAASYQAVRDAVGDGIAGQTEAGQIAAHLRDAAVAEREIGEILLARAQE